MARFAVLLPLLMLSHRAYVLQRERMSRFVDLIAVRSRFVLCRVLLLAENRLREQPPGSCCHTGSILCSAPCNEDNRVGKRMFRMRTWRLLYLGVLLCISATLWSQTSVTSPPQRDAAALTALARAVAAMGAQATAVQLNTVQETGTINPVTAPVSDLPAGTFTWTVEVKNPGYEYRHQLQSGSDISIFVSGHGSPATSFNGAIKPLLGHVALGAAPVQMPILVLVTALLDPTSTIAQATATQLGGVLATHIHISNETNRVTQALTPQEWYFDPNTGLPLRVEYHVPDPLDGLNWMSGARDFANYKAVSGFLFPLQITNWVHGTPVSVTTVSSVQLNIPVTESEFDLIAGTN